MKLKISCLKPYRCSFDCINCPFDLDFKKFDKLYKEIENDISSKEII